MRPFHIVPSGEPVAVRESWNPQPRRGTVTATRFMVQWRGRWYRLRSDSAPACRENPHFITARGVRVLIAGVAP